MQGAGNDFVFFDATDPELQQLVSETPKERAELAKKICQRKFSIGADGVAFLHCKSSNLVHWDFYNSDGSRGEMCGNAARCVSVYAKTIWNCDDEVTLETLSGKVELKFLQEKLAEIKVQTPSWVTQREKPYAVINSGVPHLVFQVESAPIPGQVTTELKEKCKALRFPDEVDEVGANVTVVELAENGLKVATYERGVEDFTYACGTGAMAAAVFAKKFLLKDQSSTSKKMLTSRFEIQMPGDRLWVEIKEDHLILGGPAQMVYKGFISL